MATRRSMMKPRAGTKPHAVRNGEGRFKDVQGRKRAHAVEMRNLSAEEVGARLDAAERRLTRATHSAANLMRSSMYDVIDAGKVVRDSAKQAFAAVTRASRRIAKRFSTAAQAAAPIMKPAPKALRRASTKPAPRIAA